MLISTKFYNCETFVLGRVHWLAKKDPHKNLLLQASYKQHIFADLIYLRSKQQEKIKYRNNTNKSCQQKCFADNTLKTTKLNKYEKKSKEKNQKTSNKLGK